MVKEVSLHKTSKSFGASIIGIDLLSGTLKNPLRGQPELRFKWFSLWVRFYAELVEKRQLDGVTTDQTLEHFDCLQTKYIQFILTTGQGWQLAYAEHITSLSTPNLYKLYYFLSHLIIT